MGFCLSQKAFSSNRFIKSQYENIIKNRVDLVDENLVSLARTPHLSKEDLYSILDLVHFNTPDVPTKIHFHVYDEVIFLILKHSPEHHLSVWNYFFKDNLQIINNPLFSIPLPAKLILDFGIAGTQNSLIRKKIEAFYNNPNILFRPSVAEKVRHYSAIALSMLDHIPQRIEYHFELLAEWRHLNSTHRTTAIEETLKKYYNSDEILLKLIDKQIYEPELMQRRIRAHFTNNCSTFFINKTITPTSE